MLSMPPCEVGQRLLENSQLYHSRLSELEKPKPQQGSSGSFFFFPRSALARLGEQANFAFFGLDCDATERDLDNAPGTQRVFSCQTRLQSDGA